LETYNCQQFCQTKPELLLGRFSFGCRGLPGKQGQPKFLRDNELCNRPAKSAQIGEMVRKLPKMQDLSLSGIVRIPEAGETASQNLAISADWIAQGRAGEMDI